MVALSSWGFCFCTFSAKGRATVSPTIRVLIRRSVFFGRIKRTSEIENSARVYLRQVKRAARLNV
jgi:hypothetical protein